MFSSAKNLVCRVNVVRKVPGDGMSPSDEGFFLRYNVAFAVHCHYMFIGIFFDNERRRSVRRRRPFMSKKGIDSRVRALVSCAMLTALSVVLTRLLPIQIGEAMRFNLGTIPIMLAGMVFGPVYGFVVGVLADVIGYLINSMGGGFLITITFCTGLMGAVSGDMYKYLFRKKNYIALAVSISVTEIVVSGLLKSLCLLQLYGGTYWYWCSQKLITAAVMAVIEIVVIGALKKALGKKYGF